MSITRCVVGISAAIATSLIAPVPVGAVESCDARVTVRQLSVAPRTDDTRAVRYRADVSTDRPGCARVTFSIMRSYIRPDGTKFEGGIPIDVDVPSRLLAVEGEDLVQTRKVIYWWADKISCAPCAPAGAAPKPAPTGAKTAAAAPMPTTRAVGDSGGRLKLPRVGRKTAMIGGAGLVAAGAVVALGGNGGSSAAQPTATPDATAAPTAAPTPTPTAAPTAPPTPAATPQVYPGAPPSRPEDTVNGRLLLVTTFPPAGGTVQSGRTMIARFKVYAERIGDDNRLDVELWSGGQRCLRDVTAPLVILPKYESFVEFGVEGGWQCGVPFRTTLIRAILIDGGRTLLAADFPVGFDFVQ